jgi:hypothetical protein
MDPNMLRLATDPNARRDPAFVKRARASMHRETRNAAIGSVRTTWMVMGGVGGLLLLLGLAVGALAVVGLVLPSLGTNALAFPGGLLALIGGVFVGVSFFVVPPSRSLLESGVSAQASVVAVLAMGSGMTIKKPGFVVSLGRVTVALRVSPPNGVPYDVTHRELIVASDLSHLQVGATIPVRLSPTSPTKLVIDWNAIE